MNASTIKIITPILKQNVSLICVNSSTKDGVMGEVFCNTIVSTEKEEILEVNELKQAVIHPTVALLQWTETYRKWCYIIFCLN